MVEERGGFEWERREREKNIYIYFFFFQAEDGIRDIGVTGVQTCALPICLQDSAQRPHS